MTICKKCLKEAKFREVKTGLLYKYIKRDIIGKFFKNKKNNETFFICGQCLKKIKNEMGRAIGGN